uniref:Peptidase C14 caspase domain-containing protein n=1 Tax=Grammatophora oceanica TaxID=210454 RepID=A0A7S1VJ38_9STRA|mmetsp:Transcript_46647/g.69383  ORF Transcript_46647/g.69383 Transcript_46647/m.69383 type:complete len:619 (+) Transcript_46647:232-2088(+)|eukprot:CAMPEP_0194067118 /NCGR_PEP_ID=MMETSP0009_2-20130614/86387_1 /TAXON_ID=210454 /ORGANISM="Grammatophora oceanica, Strain CCMP 410" /LENGTH=618 /DNA_ID=CAMNT_0038720125 /DNA_START=227 /DNA_END=2083 /DNA_ORIENTATION=+
MKGHNGPNGMNGTHSVASSHMSHLTSTIDDTSTSHINDEEVKVNLAMADLMAYLQVVANNSNNLPLTRRDDPELTKTVSTLTADEYARKSSAFIPSDVRVIGGSFTKYGRVWDLPTSEEYTATDGAQEPGRSYGGACCNAMLKVLYDAANEAADAANENQQGNALFDDDEESAFSKTILDSSRTSVSFDDVVPETTITWSTLLRKMKAEIEEIEYAQAPMITSSRRFDLNKPFALVPDDFDTSKGKKRSLLVGCNYNTQIGAELKASHDDVRSMKDYIVNVHGFPENKGLMTVLMDDGVHKDPTFVNITEALKTLSEQSRPGDAVFIHFTGHGGRILDSAIDNDAESYDEVIAPHDYQLSGLIRDTLIFKTLLAPMRYGVTVTILMDCCDTGMVLDLPYAWTTMTDRIETLAKMSLNDNFSFVRFLKVVKTLYEGSTFTQLGKTVGTALQNHDEESSDEEDGTLGAATEMTDTDGDTTKGGKGNPLINALTACTSPSDPGKPSGKNGRQGDFTGSVGTKGTRARDNPTFLEQLINCTVGHTGDESDVEDDDTYANTRDELTAESYDEATTSTYDSMTDDGYHSPPRRGGRRSGRSRKHRQRRDREREHHDREHHDRDR